MTIPRLCWPFSLPSAAPSPGSCTVHHAYRRVVQRCNACTGCAVQNGATRFNAGFERCNGAKKRAVQRRCKRGFCTAQNRHQQRNEYQAVRCACEVAQ